MNKDIRPYKLKKEIKKKAEKVSTATLTSQLLNRGYRNTFINQLIPTQLGETMVGYAHTLRYAPVREDKGIEVNYDNDTDMQRIAVESIKEESVLVIDARGILDAASFGQIITTRIMKRGAAGLVTDGALRDSHHFKKIDLPVYFRGAHATTSSVRHYPVDQNVPIGCGEVLVMPGDILVGDSEGVVVIPALIAEEVILDAYEQDLLETFILEKVEKGSSIKGTYPAEEETLKEYEKWREKNE